MLAGFQLTPTALVDESQHPAVDGRSLPLRRSSGRAPRTSRAAAIGVKRQCTPRSRLRIGSRRTVAAPARRLPMQIGDRARGYASPAFGEKRVSGTGPPDERFHDRSTRHPAPLPAAPALMKGDGSLLARSPDLARPPASVHDCFHPPAASYSAIGLATIRSPELGCARTTSCYRIRRSEAVVPCDVGARPRDKPQLRRGRGAVRMAAVRAATGLTRPADMARPDGLVGCVRLSRHRAVRASVAGWVCSRGRAGSPNVGSSDRCAAPVPAAKQARVGMAQDR